MESSFCDAAPPPYSPPNVTAQSCSSDRRAETPTPMPSILGLSSAATLGLILLTLAIIGSAFDNLTWHCRYAIGIFARSVLGCSVAITLNILLQRGNDATIEWLSQEPEAATETSTTALAIAILQFLHFYIPLVTTLTCATFFSLLEMNSCPNRT